MRTIASVLILAPATPTLALFSSGYGLIDLCAIPGIDKLSNLVCARSPSEPQLVVQSAGIVPCLDGPCSVITTKGAQPVQLHLHEINSSPLWSYKPRCLSKENSTEGFCVYSSGEFASNRGISVFTTPEEMQKLANMPAFRTPDALDVDVNQEPDPPYIARELPGRGIGLIANRTLQRGDRIFSHTPVFVVHEDIFTTLTVNDRLSMEHTAIKRLPSKSRKAFMDLCGHFGGDHVDDVINTNSFGVDLWEREEGTAYNLVFPEISRLNHDCRPNAHYYFDAQTMTQHVQALRPIYPGEELTISYIDPSQIRKHRQAGLHTSWGFHCSCSLCRAPKAVSEASDARIKQIDELYAELQDRTAEGTATPATADLLVSLYEQERMLGPIAEGYTYAAIEYNGIGDVLTAMRYAHLAVESGVLYGGPDDHDVRAMQQLLADPRGHWSYMFRSNKYPDANMTRGGS